MSAITTNEILMHLGKIEPEAFENMAYDCLRAVGFQNLVWRTPGADGGRDIQAALIVRDPTGFERSEKWYIECKRYSKSIDWPTVWNKLSYAEAQGADFFLLVTNRNPSPKCEDMINEWNFTHRSPKIRAWRGYELATILSAHPKIACAHGLSLTTEATFGTEYDLPSVIAKVIQSAHGAMVFGQPCELELETATSLSELYTHRLGDLRLHGKFVIGPSQSKTWAIAQLQQTGDPEYVEEVSLRAIISFVLYCTRSELIEVCIKERDIYIKLHNARYKFNDADTASINAVLFWSRLDEVFDCLDDHLLHFRQREN